jgi:hypothetical protein
MRVDLSSLIRKGLSDSCDEAGLPAVGATPPPIHPVPARLWQRRWFAPAMAVAAVVVVTAVVTLLPRSVVGWTGPTSTTTDPALPKEFAGPSLLAAPVREAPPGPVAALIGYSEVPIIGDIGGGQGLAVAVNGQDYRALPGSGTSLLSPDGGQLIVGGHGALDLIDLRTGSTRTYRVGAGDLNPAAFSPDGRLVVYQHEEAGPTTTGDCPQAVLIDLATGRRTTLTRDNGCEAAFSPDGKRIAVQIGEEIVLMDTTGRTLRRLPATANTFGGYDASARLDSPHAWSPDGRFLAVRFGGDPRIGFLALNKGDTPPAPLDATVANFIGWIDPQHVVTFDHRDAEADDVLVRHALTGNASHVISTYPNGLGMVEDIAADLLPQLVAVDGGSPDYGPWPNLLNRTIIGATILLAGLILISRRRQRH